MANRIYTRSPFIVTVTGTANQETTCELYLWNGTGAAPSTPQYTLSKPIPSSLITTVNYNVSPYAREYISFTVEPAIYNTVGNTTSAQYCNATIKLYLAGVLQSTTTYYCLDGFGYYADDWNPTLQTTQLTQGTYYYYYDSTGLVSDTDKRPGHLTIDAISTWAVKYTNLVSAATVTTSLATTMLKDIYRVYPTYWADGNKVEVLDNLLAVQATYYFRPIEECKYDVLYLDFINRYGAWQKEFLFKVSKTSIEVSNTEYNLMPDNINFDPRDATKQVMNANGKESIKCNTGWVDEAWGTTLKELMLSERILLSGRPVKMKTKSVELQKHINEKLINYAIEFDYAHDIIHNII